MVDVDIPIEPRLADQAVFADPALLRRVLQAVQPFRASVQRTAAGLRVEGDAIGATLIGDILKAVVDSRGRSPGLTDQALIEGVIQADLKHQLAYRLQGVTHPLQPKSLAQVAFMEAMINGEEPLILGVGPTGTGKTHLAIAAGLSMVAEGRYDRLVVTRPNVAVGSRGDAPARRPEPEGQNLPVRDVLRQLISVEEIRRRVDQGVIELTPVELMRGRTFNGAFIVVDEAQNLTIPQMRMVLTRLGRKARMVVLGDPAQIDLGLGEVSGLTHALTLLSGVARMKVLEFHPGEIIRNDLVGEIEALYQRDLERPIRSAA